MSVEDINVVDFTSIDAIGRVVLSITDHLDWNNICEHLSLLQNKLNKYLDFIESGELLEKYPQAHGRSVLISLYMKHDIINEGKRFLEKVKTFLKKAGYDFEYRVYNSNSS